MGVAFLANPVAIWTHRTQDKKAALISINATTSAISFNSLTLLNEVKSSGFRIQYAWHYSKRSAASRPFVVVERQFFGAIGGRAAAPAPPSKYAHGYNMWINSVPCLKKNCANCQLIFCSFSVKYEWTDFNKKLEGLFLKKPLTIQCLECPLHLKFVLALPWEIWSVRLSRVMWHVWQWLFWNTITVSHVCCYSVNHSNGDKCPLMLVTHSQDSCTRNLCKFLVQVSWLCVTGIRLITALTARSDISNFPR